jgi:hypothetical protein
VLAGPETGSDRKCEQVGEVALRELGTNIGAVARFLEQVCVRVQSHTGAGVPEDVADLKNVEAGVDDQVAGEGVAQIVEARPAPTAAGRVDGLRVWCCLHVGELREHPRASETVRRSVIRPRRR